jgi:hypothetical protein
MLYNLHLNKLDQKFGVVNNASAAQGERQLCLLAERA